MRHPNTNFRRRRGIAMLLVMISLAMATILATSYLASRDNSAVIGANIATATAARWASESGLEAGVAILETESDWRTGHTNGKLVDDYAIGGASVDLDVIDVVTGDPPTEDTEYVQMTATATADGLTQRAVAVAHVPQSGDDGEVDVDLSEFAIFAGDSIELTNDATVMRWPNAPLSSLNRRLAMGTRAEDAFSVSIGDNAATIDTDVFYGPNASNSLVTISNSTTVSEVKLLDNIPLPAAPRPGVTTPDGFATGDFVLVDDGSTTLTSGGRVDNFDIGQRSMLTLQGNTQLVADADFFMRDESKVIVDGNATIVAWDDFYLRRGSAIELTDGSTLTVFVGDYLYLDDAYIGDVRADSTRDNTGNAGYMDPERVQIYSIDFWNPDSSADWQFNNNSVAKGDFYGPSAHLVMENTSAIYGRVAAKTILLKNDAAIFYDHELDSGDGFTDLDGAVYNDDGTMKSDIVSLSDLDDGTLQSLADSLGLDVTRSDLKLISSDGDGEEDGDGGGGATPRPVPVEIVMNALGTPVESWE